MLLKTFAFYSCFLFPFAHSIYTKKITTTRIVDDNSALSVNGFGENQLATSGNPAGGQKAIIAITEDNESAVIKYRSDQDMSSIGKYKKLEIVWKKYNNL